jgi:hypothetical protein
MDDEDPKRAHMEKMHQARREQARKRAMERTEKTCPDCVREGITEALPLSEFSTVRADGYVDETRISAYCKRHQAARASAPSAAWLKARLDPDSPDYDAELHERQKAAKRGWAQRKRASEGASRPEISLRAAAEQLGVSAQTVKNWQQHGELPRPLTAAAVEALARQRRGE